MPGRPGADITNGEKTRVPRSATTLARALCCAVVLALAAGPAQAGVFVYEDENGDLHFSDMPRHQGYKRLKDSKKRARATSRGRVDLGPLGTRAWDGVIAQACRTHGVEPGLVKAVVHAESRFDLYAVSHKGAQGLMQLMPATARQLGVDDPFDPWQNIQAGTRYLSYLMRRFKGDLKLALAAYNAGETTVRRFKGVPPYRETERYVKKVMNLATEYHADFR